MAQKIREQCRQLCVSLFFREQSPVRSLGFTSSLHGEGKSFLAMIAAAELAKDSPEPVTLLECNWEHPYFHTHFGFAPTPGLAEWLRGECSEMAIRHQISDNLTAIPAGDGRKDAVKLLQHIRQQNLLNIFGCVDESLIVDLPPIMTSAYGVLAASNVEIIGGCGTGRCHSWDARCRNLCATQRYLCAWFAFESGRQSRTALDTPAHVARLERAMKTISVMLVVFLGLGLCARKFHFWTRLLLIGVIVGVMLYITFA